MSEQSAYRAYWCECGQKMRVLLHKLGRQGQCVRCGARIIPTLQNTVLPGEGPRTPPPRFRPKTTGPGVPTPAEPDSTAHEIEEGGWEQWNALVSFETAEEEKVSPELHLRRLRKKRKALCAALGLLVYEQRVPLPPNKALDAALEAIKGCDSRIADLQRQLGTRESEIDQT